MLAARALLDGVKHGLAAQAIFKRCGGAFVLCDTIEQIVDAVGEGMLPANDVTGWPPSAHVGVVAVCDQHIAETLHVALIVIQQHIQFVHALKVEHNRTFRAVDFE